MILTLLLAAVEPVSPCDKLPTAIERDRCELADSIKSLPDVDCGNQETQMAMNVCSYRDYLKADIELNKAWAASVRMATGGEKSRLVDSQRKWIAFRDAQCLFVTGPREESGTIWALQQNLCSTELTLQRTKQLRDYLESAR